MSHPIKWLTHSYKESRTLWLLGGLYLAAGFGLLWISHLVQGGRSPLAEILRDFGLALWISVIIGTLIEFGLAHKMFVNGLDAIMRRTVPPQVWSEIRQHVISQPVIRHCFHITMIIKEDNGGYVSTTTLEYVLESLRDVFPHHVQHVLDADRNPKNSAGGRFRDIRVDNKPVDLRSAVSIDRLSARYDVYFEREGDRKKISVTFLESVRERDVSNWWMRDVTINLKITVVTPATLQAKVKAHHPEEKLLKPGVKVEWEFPGVMLPGQGFEIQLAPSEQGGASNPSDK